nr:hypothetical protein BaRGS_029835 [Batillaria attramentaria]
MATTLANDLTVNDTDGMPYNVNGTNDTWTLSNGTGLDGNVTLDGGEESATGANIASPIVMFLTGLLGNVLALVVLHRTRTEIRSMMFYTLVAALTWNDLIGICLTSPVTLAAYINGREMPAGDRLCRFNGFVMVCFGLSTPLIVCAMAVERSLALKCTYFYSKYCTPASARIVVVALWAFVLVFGALPLFGLGSYSLQYPRTWCFLDFHTSVTLDMVYAYVYAILNLLIVVLMTFCNLVVMATLCQVRDTRRKLSNASLNSTLLYTDAVEEKVRAPQHMRRRQQRDVELQMIWLVCAITTIFAVCWVPLMVHIVLTLSTDNTAPVLGLVAVRLASLNQTLNPWLYVILRKALLTRIRDACCRCLRDDDLDYVRHLRPKQNYGPYNHQHHSKRQNYVHVRHQLCPSSQYVGRQNEAVSLTDGGHRKQSKSGSKSGSSGKKLSGSGSDGRGWDGSESLNLCSVCRARALDPHFLRDADSSYCSQKSPSHASDAGSRAAHSLNDAVGSSSTCTDNSCSRAELRDHADGIYVDLFRHIPAPETSVSEETKPLPAGNKCRPVLGAGAREITRPVQDSSVSEADDHGYVSKVSTDSSRLSTPEAHRQQNKKCEHEVDAGHAFDAVSSGERTLESEGSERDGARAGDGRRSRPTSVSSTVTGCGLCRDSSSGHDRSVSSRKQSSSSGR